MGSKTWQYLPDTSMVNVRVHKITLRVAIAFQFELDKLSFWLQELFPQSCLFSF